MDAKKKARSNGRKPVRSVKKKRQKKKQKSIKRMSGSSVIILALFFIIITLYLGQSIYRVLTRPDIPSITVQMGSVDFPVVFDGIIIRSENVYQSPIEGIVSFNYNELERIRKNDAVCSVWNQREYNAWLEQELAKVNTDMLNLQERRGQMSAFEQDVVAYNERIKEYIDSRVYEALDIGVAGTYELKDNIAQNISVRNQMSLSENRGSVQNLYDQRQIYESQLNSNASQMRVTRSGILSYSVDGLESELSPPDIPEISESQLRTTVNLRRASNENLMNAGDPVFKIVESNEWYIATYINIDLAFSWSEGMSRVIYVQTPAGYRELDATIHKINKYDKEAYVIFKLTKYMIDFINMRNVRLKVTASEHNGYKIPNSAIVDKTLLKLPAGYLIESDMVYVLKRSSDRDIMTPVTVAEKTDEYCLISQDFNALSLGDLIVKDDGSDEYTVAEVENCKGVYVINNGYAIFRRIKLNDVIPEKNPYTILNPNDNKSLRIFDRIVSDARSVLEGQKVY